MFLGLTFGRLKGKHPLFLSLLLPPPPSLSSTPITTPIIIYVIAFIATLMIICITNESDKGGNRGGNGVNFGGLY